MTRFARGWHCLGLAETFRDGQPHGIDAFGTKLVVYATPQARCTFSTATAGTWAATCPGAPSRTTSMACPFHDWRWGSDGKCKLVPYAKRTPRLARTRTWPTTRGQRPAAGLARPRGVHARRRSWPPRRSRVTTRAVWSPWQWNSILIEGSHCREIVDNNVDMAHFFYIHHAYPTYFKNVIEGHTASQFMESKPRPDYIAEPDKLWDGTHLRSEATYFGPAYMINWLHNDLAPGFTVEVALINCHYPVSHNSFVLQWGVAVQEMPGSARRQGRQAGRRR